MKNKKLMKSDKTENDIKPTIDGQGMKIDDGQTGSDRNIELRFS